MPLSRRIGLSMMMLLAMMTCASSRAAGEVSRLAVTIRVYQTAGLPPDVEQRALQEARTVLGVARVDVTWINCSGEEAAQCGVPPRRSELLLNLVTVNPWRKDLETLGTAQLAKDGAYGQLATINVRRVARLAAAGEIDLGVLLGRVSAHEIGHLLIGAHAHSPAGLMRPGWNADQIREGRSVDWRFTPENISAMRGSSAGRAADAATANPSTR